MRPGEDAAAAGQGVSLHLARIESPVTDLVGRAQMLEELSRLLGTSRLVTLQGTGGIGKSRLALEAVRSSRGSYPGGCWLLDAARLVEAARPAGAADYDNPPTVVRLALDLGRRLGHRKTLILLDGCELDVRLCARFSQALLRAHAQVRILATGREALSIDGETVVSVPPLPYRRSRGRGGRRQPAEPEAVRLFVERAAARRPATKFDPPTLSRVEDICAAVGGIPAAIEMAAGRLSVLSLAEILDRLAHPLDFLVSSDRLAPPGKKDARALVESTARLLGEKELRMWGRLSVFAGGFDLEAAMVVGRCAGGSQDDPLELLTALVERSVVRVEQRGPRVRYSLLPLERQFGLELLSRWDEEDAARRAHRDWFLALAEDAEVACKGSGQAEWFDRLEVEHANFVEALDTSAQRLQDQEAVLRIGSALWLFWHVRGHHSEARRWLSDALSQPAGGPALRAKALTTAGILAHFQGDTDTAVSLHEQSLAIRRTANDRRGIAFSLFTLGIAVMYRGDLERASELLEESLKLHRELGDPVGTYCTAYELAEVHCCRGIFDRAAQLFEMALDLTRRQGDTWHTNWVLFGSGILSWRRGDLAGAERLLRKSLALADGIGDRWLICLSLEGLAWLEESQGRAQRAVCLMSAAEAQWRVNGGALVHPYRLHRDSSMQRARESLDPTTLDTALAKGAAMSLEEALEFALDRRSGPCGETGLTIRETVIARLIAEGLTSRQIAARLHIAERTAEAHTEHIRAKLGFRSRAQVAAWIVQHDRDQRLREELRAQADI